MFPYCDMHSRLGLADADIASLVCDLFNVTVRIDMRSRNPSDALRKLYFPFFFLLQRSFIQGRVLTLFQRTVFYFCGGDLTKRSLS